MAAFTHYVGIDYSGAETPNSSLKGLRVYEASRSSPPTEILPPPSPRKYWTRRGVAHWLLDRLQTNDAVIVGIDHGFSFPIRYFETHRLEPDWDLFLDDFHAHWPTDADNTYVDFVRDGLAGNGAARAGSAKWRRLTEIRARAAKSVFHFDVQGSVAKSTHSGIPWLRFLRRNLNARLHFWPFDGWNVPTGHSAIVEVYPALWKHLSVAPGLTSDQQDAYAVARWLQLADEDGQLASALATSLHVNERRLAMVEGWILGVGAA